MVDADCDTNVLMDVAAKNTGYTHMALEVTNLESTMNKIKNLGIKITGEVKTEHAIFFFIRDPDMNVIEFNQPV